MAEDLLSQTFLVAYERRASFDANRGEVRGWLYGIAGNLLRHHWREQQRQLIALARMPLGDSSSEDIAIRTAERVDASRAGAELTQQLAALSHEDRDVLLLFAWADLGYAEIATALGIPVGTVRS